MNVALRRALTVPEYLAWGATQSELQRTELINGQIVAMSPERAAHNRIKKRLVIVLERTFAATGVQGEVFTDGMTVPIEPHTAYEPDAIIHCGDPIPADQLTVPAPVVVVEVLSPSTAHTDTSAKLIGYFKVPSVCHYLVIDPDARTVTHHARSSDGTPRMQTLSAGALALDPPGITFDVAELFG